MKPIILFLLLTAFSGEPTCGQVSPSQKSLQTKPPQFPGTQNPPEKSKQTLKQLLVSSSSSYQQEWEKATHRSAEPFFIFVDPTIGSLSATSQHKKHVDGDLASNDQSFQWSPAIRQSLIFLAVQHGYALTQPKTRRDLKGSFFKDYARSVKSLHGWADGGRFFTNYVAHPLEGSFLGFIQVQNDPKGRSLRYNESAAYWRSRLKALAWSAAWSTQFEIGPVSQASIGNVGLHGKQTYVDIVMTPTAGIGLLILEDFLDENLIKMIERKSRKYYIRIASRTFLNPSRSVANVMRFKPPWYRDEGLR